MTQHRQHSFFKGIFLYTIGNIGSKIVNTLLFPIFSFYILPNQMGLFDLSIIFVYLIIPILTLNVKESAIRFLLDPLYKDQENYVIRFCLQKALIGIVISVVIAILIFIFHPITYFFWIFITFIVTLIFEIVIQITRGMGHTKEFVFINILNSLLIAIVSIVLIVVFKMDIKGVFIAHVVSRILCMLYIDRKIHFVEKALSVRVSNLKFEKEMLKYALPFLPNFILFWVIENSSRIFISQFLGVDQNGLYAIVIKFSSILLTLSTIFYQTWQELAIKYFHSDDRNNFFTRIFNQYFLGLSLAVIIIGFSTKSIYPYIVDSNYHKGTVYIFPLLVAVLFYALSLFIDMSYQCSKKSAKSLPSIVTTAILSIILNFVFIKPFGMMGVVYALIISYVYLTIFRLVDSYKIIPIQIKKESWIAIVILTLGWIINEKVSNLYVLFSIAVVSLFLSYLLFGRNAVFFLKKR